MSWDDRDTHDMRTGRPSRRDTQPTDRLAPDDLRYADPVNPNWRGERASSRMRRTQTLPSSRQEFLLWLQYGGWRFAGAVVAVLLLGLLFVVLSSSGPKPLQIEQNEPVVEEPLNQQLLVPQPSVTPVLTTPTSIPQLSGARFRVFNTGVEGLFLRPAPNTNNVPIKTLQDGTIVTVVGEDHVGPDRVWKQVRDAEGAQGWVAAEYLQSQP